MVFTAKENKTKTPSDCVIPGNPQNTVNASVLRQQFVFNFLMGEAKENACIGILFYVQKSRKFFPFS